MTIIEVEFLFPAFTYRATSFSAYSINLFFKSFKVNFVPYFPANGDVLTLIETPINGGSILIDGITFSGNPYSITVFVTLQFGNPAIETMSPAKALSSYRWESPVILVILVTLPF